MARIPGAKTVESLGDSLSETAQSLSESAQSTAHSLSDTAHTIGGSLGEYLREQRRQAELSLRQLAEQTGVSNPYLSQIERGVRRPSADVLQQIAKALRISAESLYVRAGILDERDELAGVSVETAIAADPDLTERQRDALLDIYRSFVAARPTT